MEDDRTCLAGSGCYCEGREGLSWIRLDDNFPDHPKVITLSDKAFRVYISGLCYSSRYLTDGFLADPVVNRLDGVLSAEELVLVGLWSRRENGWEIASYAEYQTSKEQVEAAKARNRERVAKWRKRSQEESEDSEANAITNAISNELVMEPHTHTHTPIHTHTDIKDKTISLPRVKTARSSVERISNKLAEARANGVNAWNLSKLIQEEWDILHDSNDIGGCIALTAWYVSELLSRELTSQEIARMGQMTKRFGRIALLAIDEAASKDLEDLVSYAFRIAQNMYTERKA